jgi:uncharacterized protein YhfF
MTVELPTIEFAFPGELRDRLIAAIKSGAKTSTSSLLREYQVEDQAIPVAGFRGAVIDSTGERIFIIETTRVNIVELRDVPLSHAVAEGEGYKSVADWREGHARFWQSPEMRAALGSDFQLDDTSLVVLERFKVIP